MLLGAANKESEQKNQPEESQGSCEAKNEQNFVVTIHSNEFSDQDVVINPDIFKGYKPKDVLLITIVDKKEVNQDQKDANKPKSNSTQQTSALVVQITDKSLKPNWNKSISINKSIADLYNMDNKTEIKISMCNELSEEYELDSVDITIKDQFLTRRDQWNLWNYCLTNRTVYPQQYIDYQGIRCRIKTW